MTQTPPLNMMTHVSPNLSLLVGTNGHSIPFGSKTKVTIVSLWCCGLFLMDIYKENKLNIAFLDNYLFELLWISSRRKNAV